MILLTVDEIIMLHSKLLAATGGMPGLRDRGLLEFRRIQHQRQL